MVASVDGLATDGVYELELNAVSAHLGADTADLEYLLSQLLAHEVTRHQIQPLLEQGWMRLQALRERIGELQVQFSDLEITGLIEQANNALAARAPLTVVEERLERAFQICCDKTALSASAAGLRAPQALAVALSMDFRRAATFSDQAAELAQANPEARWQYRVQQVEFLREQGREFRDIEALQSAERLCLDTLLPMAPADSLPDERAWVQDYLGNTLGILGRQHRGTRMLERAIEAFEEALPLWGHERRPQDWAATQNNLGNAIGVLGQRQQDQDMLAQSIAAFEAALEVQTQDTMPQAWASTHSNLAAVLQTVGQQKKDSKMLKRAVDGYKAALTVWTRERKPLVWALTMRNLGSALRLLGNLRKGPRTLEQSVAAYNAALSVQTRDRLPHDWAMTQNDLGAALQAVGERSDDVLALGRAVAAYREALKEITRENGPMTWAMSIANLGVARRKLAERNYDATIAEQAAADIKMAVDVFRGASHAKLTELGEEQLSLARKLATSLKSSASPNAEDRGGVRQPEVPGAAD